MGIARMSFADAPLQQLWRSNYSNGALLSCAPTTICAAAASAAEIRLLQTSNGSESRRSTQPQHHRLGLRPRRFSSRGLKTSVLELQCSRTERSSVILAGSVQEDPGAPLNQNEVVDLLLVAVNVLLEPKNQERLQNQLGKTKQHINQRQSSVSVLSSKTVQYSSSPAPVDALQVVEEEIYSEVVERADALNTGGHISDPVSLENVSSNEGNNAKIVPIPSNMTDVVHTQVQSESIESVQSTTESIESREDTSLTSIRKLKVLNVHSYIHNALRESALRSWLHSRKIEE